MDGDGPGADAGHGRLDLGASDTGTEVDAAVPDAGSADAGAPDLGELGRSPCDSINDAFCWLPFPSGRNFLDNPGSPANRQLIFFEDVFPFNDEMHPFDATRLGFFDGYPVDARIVTALPGAVLDGLPGEEQIEASLADDARILLFRQDGLELTRIPYWVDTDPRFTDPEVQPILVNPAGVFEPNERYIVALRGFRDAEGMLLPASVGFGRLRAGTTEGTRLERLQAEFDDLLSLIAAEDIDTSTLQAAWNFRTSSAEGMHFRTTAIVEAYRQWKMQRGGLTFSPFEDEQGNPGATPDSSFPPESAWEIRFDGTMTMPSFLMESEISGQRGLVLASDNRVDVRLVEEVDVPFSIRFNRSVVPPNSTVGALVVLGHPLYGDMNYLDAPELEGLAGGGPMVVAVTDWTGLTSEIRPVLEGAANDLNTFQFVADQALQGLVAQLLMADVAAEFMSHPDIESIVPVDRERLHFLGVGQSGAFGAIVASASERIATATLVGASPDIAHALERRRSLQPVLDGPDGLVATYGVHAWVMAEVMRMFLAPLSHHSAVQAFALPGFDRPDILWTHALSDPEATHLDAERQARASGALPLLSSHPRSLPGAASVTYPQDGSGVVVFDVGDGFPAPGPVPPSVEDDPRARLLQSSEHTELLHTFWRTGQIVDVCEGGACVLMD